MKSRSYSSKFLAVILSLVLTLSLSTMVSAATAGSDSAAASTQTMIVDGKEVAVEAYNINGSSYLKLRDIAQLLNGTKSQFSISFDTSSHTVIAVPGESYIAAGGELQTGKDKSSTCSPSDWVLKINGLSINAKAYNLGGNNFFRLNDLSSALGFAVDFNKETNSAVITCGGYSLAFNADDYTTGTTTVDGESVTYRAYTNIPYVKYPADTNYEYLNVYIPESAVNSQTAPIFFPSQIGGYMPAEPILPVETASIANGSGKGNIVSAAISKGYIVVSPGARGSVSEVNGVFTGKAPAAIVDLKAAVRYLRYNDGVMPGSAEKIISSGTSAGGALSALLGASGNDALYEPYLSALGAADENDDIFAAVTFCPITDLEHSDIAYEWIYNRVIDDTDADGKSLYGFTDTQKALSAELKALYPAYLNGMGLKSVYDGTALTDANFEDYIKTFVIASAQKALDNGIDISDKTWSTISNGTVTDVDFDAYLSYVTRFKMIKDPPAFDWLGDQSTNPPRSKGSRENLLFGTADKPTNIFTDFVAEKLGTTVSQDVKDRVYLMNALNFVGKEGSDNTPNWYIRHGSVDRDTAFTVPVSLYTKLMNAGTTEEVDFGLAWERPHSGDYELNELFAWMGKISN